MPHSNAVHSQERPAEQDPYWHIILRALIQLWDAEDPFLPAGTTVYQKARSQIIPTKAVVIIFNSSHLIECARYEVLTRFTN